MARTRMLDPLEARVIGSLMEKEQTTPEYYPMTVNALVAACNQKSNREPVMEVTEEQVQATLEALRQDVLVWRTESARSTRWQHSLDRRWGLDPSTKALMTLLLLRGAQTVGELRMRSERLHTFASLAEVESALERLASGFDALVREQPRQPGQRETRWFTLIVSGEAPPAVLLPAVPPAVAQLLDSTAPDRPAPDRPAPDRPAPDRLGDLVDRLARLETEVRTLGQQLEDLRQRLGDL